MLLEAVYTVIPFNLTLGVIFILLSCPPGVRDALDALHGWAGRPLQHPFLHLRPVPSRAAVLLVGAVLEICLVLKII